MRLIDLYSMRLREFVGDQIPPYGILSHTWGDGEVTFTDFKAGNAKDKLGFEKIHCLCTQAKLDGLEFVWCDTCCTDKSSSAELSESINSMFKWYQNAEICYAHLSDVYTGEPGFFERQFGKSRWFQRGWTLQELIAPKPVRFYGNDWDRISRQIRPHQRNL